MEFNSTDLGLVLVLGLCGVFLALYFRFRHEPDSYERNRRLYIEDLLGTPTKELAAGIADIEIAMQSANPLERQIQRHNLDCLNTAYVLRLLNEDEGKFWDLHRRQKR